MSWLWNRAGSGVTGESPGLQPHQGRGEDRRRGDQLQASGQVIAVRQSGHQGPHAVHHRQGDQGLVNRRDLFKDGAAGLTQGPLQVAGQVLEEALEQQMRHRFEGRVARQLVQGPAAKGQLAGQAIDIRQHRLGRND